MDETGKTSSLIQALYTAFRIIVVLASELYLQFFNKRENNGLWELGSYRYTVRTPKMISAKPANCGNTIQVSSGRNQSAIESIEFLKRKRGPVRMMI
jgi:hypothetical protein